MIRKRQQIEGQQIGPARYWRVVEGGCGELRVEPNGMPGLPLLMLIVFAVFAVLVWFIPDWELSTRLFLSAGALFVGFVSHVAAAGQHQYELRQAPFLIVDKMGFRLRGDIQIPLDAWDEFIITSKSDLDGVLSSLMLRCKRGEEQLILSSLNARDIEQLKCDLERHLEQLFRNERPLQDGRVGVED